MQHVPSHLHLCNRYAHTYFYNSSFSMYSLVHTVSSGILIYTGPNRDDFYLLHLVIEIFKSLFYSADNLNIVTLFTVVMVIKRV